MGAYPLLTSGRPIIFFDSSCLLCNKAVQTILKIDKKKLFMFAGLSSECGMHILSENKIEEDTIILYHHRKCRTKSCAVLAICKLLGLPYSIMSIFYVIPIFIRDWVYDIIASNRKKWFGTTDHCLIDTNNYSDRIIL